MKHCLINLLRMVVVVFAAANQLFGQGMPIIQHSGANDPATEGFIPNLSNGATGLATEDSGVNAWTTTCPASGWAYYYAFFTSDQIAQLAGQNWTLSLTLRDVGMNSYAGFVTIAYGTGQTGLSFGTTADGNPEVLLGNYLYVLNDTSSAYNNYQLTYNSTTSSVDLWVNGADRISDKLVQQNSGWLLEWGLQSGPAQINWNLVSLNIPEPSAASLIFLGSAILVYVRKRNLKHSRRPSSG